ncbi:hypothetical protein EGW08_001347 [Elysia chlorotica]|uniref:Prokineticin domain-containing protein n=1 Tax=Elysia chlorotica TaxID=188477 RepID=A0A433UAJ2_ELYCH|nr:hypothetical protein EGW08_001347 [Elysia chlorotica]
MGVVFTSRQLTTLAVAYLLLLGAVKTQDRIEMKCNPSFRHRYEICPAGYCCVRDEFLPTFVYCRKFGDQYDNCTTKETESECPCADGLKCLANIQGKFPSVYGRCVVNATTPATTVTTASPATTEPVSTNLTTVADETTAMVNISSTMVSPDGNTTLTQEQTTEVPLFNTTDSMFNSTDASDNSTLTQQP